jgi:DNA-3-methyladenine glycosylase II
VTASSGLDEVRLAEATADLARRDEALGRAVGRFGPPPLWPRPPGFQTLVRLILEQQVSLDSGAAAYRRLEAAAGAVEPGRVVVAGETALRAAGLTRQKSRYLVALAEQLLDGRLRLDDLAGLDDERVRGALTLVPGIGAWTADCYLIFALRRPDAWPTGDLALATATREVLDLAARPAPAELAAIGERWRPWRAVAARILWHSYLVARGRPV